MEYAPIHNVGTNYPKEFLDWWSNVWSIENDSNNLRASFDDQMRGAFIEWTYIQRGAQNNPKKYCDVFVDGVSVDTKCVTIRKSRKSLFPYVYQNTCVSRREFYKRVGIQEVHFWALPQHKSTAELWMIYHPETNTITEF